MSKYDKRTGCVVIQKRKATIYDSPAFRAKNKALEKKQKLLLKGVKELIALGG